MTLIQIILLTVVIMILLYIVKNGANQKGRAYKRILLFILLTFSMLAIFWPEGTNNVAHVFGVGRGADLLLYCLAVAYFLTTLNVYIKLQEYRNNLHSLARRQAISEAQSNCSEKNK